MKNIWLKISAFFAPSRLFEVTPAPIGKYLYLAIFFGVCVVVAIILKIMVKKFSPEYRRLIKKLIPALWIPGGVGLILIFMRWQSMPYFGSRFILIVLIVLMLIWFEQIIWYQLIEVPRIIKLKQEKEKLYKYLPRKKAS